MIVDDQSAAPPAADRRARAEQFAPLARAEARRFAARKRLDAESADELEAVALFTLMRASVKYRPERGAFAVYAGKFVRHELRKAYRTSGFGGRRTAYSTAPVFEPIPSASSGGRPLVDRRACAPDERLVADEEVRRWWGRLPNLERQAVRLLCLEGRPLEEAAAEARRPGPSLVKARTRAAAAFRRAS